MTDEEKRERRMRKIMERAAKMQGETVEGDKQETDKLLQEKPEEVPKEQMPVGQPKPTQSPPEQEQSAFTLYRASKKSQQFEKKLLLASKIAGAAIGLLACQKTSGWTAFFILLLITATLSYLQLTNSKPPHPAQIPLLDNLRSLQIVGHIEYLLSLSIYLKFYLNSIGFFSLALIAKIQLGLL